MTGPTKFTKAPHHDWMALNAMDVGDKFILEEPVNHSTARRLVETGFILLVGILLVGSYLVFILPGLPPAGAYSAVSISGLGICSALFLYAFSTRGHALQVGIDRARKQVWLCKLNSQGHARIITHFARHDVASLYIQRPSGSGREATLMARLNGKATPATLLHGSVQDIEAAHGILCRELRETSPIPFCGTLGTATPKPATKARIFSTIPRGQTA